MVRKYRRHIFFVTILLVIFVFFGGFLLGRNIVGSDVQQITEFIKENELNTESYLIEQDLTRNFEQGNCELASVRIAQLSDELGAIGTMLEKPDAQEKMGADNFDFLKRKFHLMQIKTYIMFKKMIEECSLSTNIILYYYSIGDGASAEQGYILDNIVEDYDVKVFAIEYGYADELEFLEDYYNIKKTPSLIINYNKKKEGLTRYNEIEEILR